MRKSRRYAGDFISILGCCWTVFEQGQPAMAFPADRYILSALFSRVGAVQSSAFWGEQCCKRENDEEQE